MGDVHRGRIKYCSRDCYFKSRIGRERLGLRKRQVKNCIQCGKGFETGGRAGKENQVYCSRLCAAILKNKGQILGRKINNGYVWLAMAGHPMAQRGYVLEHRLKCSIALGRPLTSSEVVHHIDGQRDNNENANLLICSPDYHKELHAKMACLYQLEVFRKMSQADALAEMYRLFGVKTVAASA